MSKEDEKNFEELMDELNTLVKDLEGGNTNLDESIDKYTKAMTIAKACNEKLDNAQGAVNKILKDNGFLDDFNVEE
ncbi:MAG: exodeoxyribonuclease VII small subunit [Clostridia bacterium]|nr:exodeoxyribonuclease VII small subunit [Clostridia bacterium]